MPKDIIKAIARRYEALILLIAAVFVVILVYSKASGRLFANIIATLVLLALIPFIIILLIRKQKKENKKRGRKYKTVFS